MSAGGLLAAVIVLTLVASPVAMPTSPRDGPASMTAIPVLTPPVALTGVDVTRIPAVGNPVAESSQPPRPNVVPANTGIIVGPGSQKEFDLEWPYLTWEDWQSGIPQVKLKNLTSGVEQHLWPRTAEQRSPTIRNGLLAFSNSESQCVDSCIVFYEISSGNMWIQTIYGGFGGRVAVADPYFIALHYGVHGPATIDVYYISNGTEAFWGGPAGGSEGEPVSAGGTVAMGLFPHPSYVNEMGVFFVSNFSTETLTNSAETFARHVPGWWGSLCRYDFTREWFPAISGSKVYWQDNRNSAFSFGYWSCDWSGERWDVYGFDLASGREFPVLTNPWNEANPDADGNLFTWTDDRNGNWDIYAKYLDTGREIRITDDSATQQEPVVSGDCIVWEDYRNGNWDLYGTCLSPNAPPTIDSVLAAPAFVAEGDPITFTVNASDPDGDSLSYAFDFDSDGTIDLTSPSGNVTHVWGDDFLGNATVTVSDWNATVTATIPVQVTNLPPTINPRVSATLRMSFDLDVSGGVWGGAVMSVFQNGNEVTRATTCALPCFRRAGPLTIRNLNLDLLVGGPVEVRVDYGPLIPVVIAPSTGTATALLVLRTEGSPQVRLSHAFDPTVAGTWNTGDLRAYVTGGLVRLQASTSDPGSDDLTFTWSWGDGTPDATSAHYRNGVGPDPYPSPDVNPVTATDFQFHWYTSAGQFRIGLTVTDDDGGTDSTVFLIEAP